jgi:hypothetical protein
MITFTSSVQVSGVRFSNRIRPAVSESLMKWAFFHRCWSSVATKSVFRSRYLLTPETLYETTPKWHGLLMIKLAASMAGHGLNSKQIELNVEHRTSNIERRILMTLRFI